jgi:hypothetical protein
VAGGPGRRRSRRRLAPGTHEPAPDGILAGVLTLAAGILVVVIVMRPARTPPPDEPASD